LTLSLKKFELGPYDCLIFDKLREYILKR